MKLNLGAGDVHLSGYLQVDFRGGDVIADARALPFRDGCAEEVRADDLLEHVPAAQTQAMLAEWRRVLADDGTLRVRVPNLLLIARELVRADEAGRATAAVLLIRNVYGGHRWGPEGSLDAHHHGFTPSLLTAELAQAGFLVDSLDGALNMTAVARKV